MPGEQVRKELLNLDPPTFASKYIFESVPHVFADDMDSYVSWKAVLGERIEVDPRAIAITGSAGVGISLSPEKSPREFGSNSDIDVAVVSFHHFDLAWRCLRAMPSALRMSLNRRQRESAKDHERRLIYWGTIATDRILDVLPFSTLWLKALSDMAGIDPTAERNINARIYRDFESLRAYQLRSVEKTRSNLEAEGNDRA